MAEAPSAENPAAQNSENTQPESPIPNQAEQKARSTPDSPENNRIYDPNITDRVNERLNRIVERRLSRQQEAADTNRENQLRAELGLPAKDTPFDQAQTKRLQELGYPDRYIDDPRERSDTLALQSNEDRIEKSSQLNPNSRLTESEILNQGKREQAAQKERARILRDSPSMQAALDVMRDTPDIRIDVNAFLDRRRELIKDTIKPGERQRDFAPLFTGLAMSERGRQVMDLGIDKQMEEQSRWHWEQIGKGNDYVHEIVIGSGAQAVIYNAERMAMLPEDPGLTIEQNDRIGGTFGETQGAVWYLNSRVRPENPGLPNLPGTEGSLNTLGKGVLQESDLTSRAYATNEALGTAIKVDHLFASRMMAGVEVRGLREVQGGKGRYEVDIYNPNTAEMQKVFTDRLVFTTGLGEATSGLNESDRTTRSILRREEAKAAAGEDARVYTFDQFKQAVGDPTKTFPIEGWKNVIVVGPNDSGKVAIEYLLGFGPDAGKTVANLDRVEEITWVGQQAQTKEQFENQERPRYRELGLEFPREGKSDYYSRIEPVQGRGQTLLEGPNGQIGLVYRLPNGDERTIYADHVILTTGFEDKTDEIFKELRKFSVPEKDKRLITNPEEIKANFEKAFRTPGSVLKLRSGEGEDVFNIRGVDIATTNGQEVVKFTYEGSSELQTRVLSRFLDNANAVPLRDLRSLEIPIQNDTTESSEPNEETLEPLVFTDKETVIDRLGTAFRTKGSNLYYRSVSGATLDLTITEVAGGQVSYYLTDREGNRFEEKDSVIGLTNFYSGKIQDFSQPDSIRLEIPQNNGRSEKQAAQTKETITNPDEINSRLREALGKKGTVYAFEYFETPRSIEVLDIEEVEGETIVKYKRVRPGNEVDELSDRLGSLVVAYAPGVGVVKPVSLEIPNNQTEDLIKTDNIERDIFTKLEEMQQNLEKGFQTPGSVIEYKFANKKIDFRLEVKSFDPLSERVIFNRTNLNDLVTTENLTGSLTRFKELFDGNQRVLKAVQIPKEIPQTQTKNVESGSEKEVITDPEDINRRAGELIIKPGVTINYNAENQLAQLKVLEVVRVGDNRTTVRLVRVGRDGNQLTTALDEKTFFSQNDRVAATPFFRNSTSVEVGPPLEKVTYDKKFEIADNLIDTYKKIGSKINYNDGSVETIIEYNPNTGISKIAVTGGRGIGGTTRINTRVANRNNLEEFNPNIRNITSINTYKPSRLEDLQSGEFDSEVRPGNEIITDTDLLRRSFRRALQSPGSVLEYSNNVTGQDYRVEIKSFNKESGQIVFDRVNKTTGENETGLQSTLDFYSGRFLGDERTLQSIEIPTQKTPEAQSKKEIITDPNEIRAHLDKALMTPGAVFNYVSSENPYELDAAEFFTRREEIEKIDEAREDREAVITYKYSPNSVFASTLSSSRERYNLALDTGRFKSLELPVREQSSQKEIIADPEQIKAKLREGLAIVGSEFTFGSPYGEKDRVLKIIRSDGKKVDYDTFERQADGSEKLIPGLQNRNRDVDDLASTLMRNLRDDDRYKRLEIPIQKSPETQQEKEVLTDPEEIKQRIEELLTTPGTRFNYSFSDTESKYTLTINGEPGKEENQPIPVTIIVDGVKSSITQLDKKYLTNYFTSRFIPPSFQSVEIPKPYQAGNQTAEQNDEPQRELITDPEEIKNRINSALSLTGTKVTFVLNGQRYFNNFFGEEGNDRVRFSEIQQGTNNPPTNGVQDIGVFKDFFALPTVKVESLEIPIQAEVGKESSLITDKNEIQRTLPGALATPGSTLRFSTLNQVTRYDVLGVDGDKLNLRITIEGLDREPNIVSNYPINLALNNLNGAKDRFVDLRVGSEGTKAVTYTNKQEIINNLPSALEKIGTVLNYTRTLPDGTSRDDSISIYAVEGGRLGKTVSWYQKEGDGDPFDQKEPVRFLINDLNSGAGSGFLKYNSLKTFELPPQTSAEIGQEKEVLTDQKEIENRLEELVETPGVKFFYTILDNNEDLVITIDGVPNEAGDPLIPYTFYRNGKREVNDEVTIAKSVLLNYFKSRGGGAKFQSVEVPTESKTQKEVVLDKEIITDKVEIQTRLTEALTTPGTVYTFDYLNNPNGREVYTITEVGNDRYNPEISYTVQTLSIKEDRVTDLDDLRQLVDEGRYGGTLEIPKPSGNTRSTVEKEVLSDEPSPNFYQAIRTPGTVYTFLRRGRDGSGQRETVKVISTREEDGTRFIKYLRSIEGQPTAEEERSTTQFNRLVRTRRTVPISIDQAEEPESFIPKEPVRKTITDPEQIKRVLPYAVETQGSIVIVKSFSGNEFKYEIINVQNRDGQKQISSKFNSPLFSEEVQTLDKGRLLAELTGTFPIESIALPQTEGKSLILDKEEIKDKLDTALATVGTVYTYEYEYDSGQTRIERIRILDVKQENGEQTIQYGFSIGDGQETVRDTDITGLRSLDSSFRPISLEVPEDTPLPEKLNFEFVYDLEDRNSPIARKLEGQEIYKIGPAAELPLTEAERRRSPALEQITENTAAIFRYAGYTAKLARINAQKDIENPHPAGLTATPPEKETIILPSLKQSEGGLQQTEFTFQLPESSLGRLPIGASTEDYLRFSVASNLYPYQFPPDAETLNIDLQRPDGSNELRIKTSPLPVSEGKDNVVSRLISDPTMQRLVYQLTDKGINRSQGIRITIPINRGSVDIRGVKWTASAEA